MKHPKTNRVSTLLVCIFFLSLFLRSVACEAASGTPEYAESGTISGTPLQYQNLVVNKHGVVAVTIYNPTNTGVSFSANFAFHDSKGNYLTGFSLSGFASRNTRSSHIEEGLDYKKFRKAASVKVLGRSGRTTE